QQVFEQLLDEGIFSRSIPEIENSDLFKLSPFKALTTDQAAAVEDILDGLFQDLEAERDGTVVIQGDPGTGKTVVATYLIKLLADIAESKPEDEPDPDSVFADFFKEGYRELLENFRVGLVVPQQSLRASIERVFKRTPGLSAAQVLTPFQVGESDDAWDLLIVDEAHRLNQRANQSSGALNRKFIDINIKLFGVDDPGKTQLDWIRAVSRHQILLVDPLQSVRPADLPSDLVLALLDQAKSRHRFYPLTSQMRVRAGEDYVGYIRSILRPGSADPGLTPVSPQHFEDYDLRFFDDLGVMHDAIRERDVEHGLARLVAGYAWEWKSRKNTDAFDIELDDRNLRWNTTDKDWINSSDSLDEVGSIHTVQGYDLNYAGVIIGRDLQYDLAGGRLRADLDQYFDTKGKENNPKLGRTYSDDEILRFITNIYTVLLTRGIRGTYVYVCDPALRERLRAFFE
ncbi:MAG TPA: DNA/RNA helicase domain-containing protein, partial [Terrimesophilobacter sp.]|nr:DNA/RNA helicase domain-containing protein [Terrimesophilobacter sp.]